MTSMVSRHLKTLQKALSKMRDDRVKVTNEVLAGMKVRPWGVVITSRVGGACSTYGTVL